MSSIWRFCWSFLLFRYFCSRPLPVVCFAGMPVRKRFTPRFSCGWSAVSKGIALHAYALTNSPGICTRFASRLPSTLSGFSLLGGRDQRSSVILRRFASWAPTWSILLWGHGNGSGWYFMLLPLGVTLVLCARLYASTCARTRAFKALWSMMIPLLSPTTTCEENLVAGARASLITKKQVWAIASTVRCACRFALQVSIYAMACSICVLVAVRALMPVIRSWTKWAMSPD